MSPAIQPVIMTPDLERLQIFYTALLGAEETSRVPDKGPTFFVGLRIGDAALDLVADEDVQIGTRQRMLLSVDVENPDDLLGRVEALGRRVLGPPKNMPWGQRVAHIEDPDGNAVNLTRQI